MTEPVVTFTKSDSLGYITVNRPPANSYEIGFVGDLDTAIGSVNDDPEIKVAIVRSAIDKFFSAGADIKAFYENTSEVNTHMVRAANKTLDKMAACAKIFIAVIQGHALGGGLEIALACDLRFAANGRYRLGLPEVTLGLLPDTGGTQRLPRLIGVGKALELMLSGDTVSPQEALDLGIVNRLYPRDTVEKETESYARKLSDGAALAVAHIKQAVYQGSDLKLTDALALERHVARPLFDTEDAREGLAAFVEKRAPSFQGRRVISRRSDLQNDLSES